MASPTTAVALTATEYTLISDGNENCTVSLRTVGTVRLYRGSAQPAFDTSNYRTVGRDGFAYGSLASPNNKIYARAEKGVATIEVDAG